MGIFKSEPSLPCTLTESPAVSHRRRVINAKKTHLEQLCNLALTLIKVLNLFRDRPDTRELAKELLTEHRESICVPAERQRRWLPHSTRDQF